jgi:hypothetical protein
MITAVGTPSWFATATSLVESGVVRCFVWVRASTRVHKWNNSKQTTCFATGSGAAKSTLEYRNAGCYFALRHFSMAIKSLNVEIIATSRTS